MPRTIRKTGVPVLAVLFIATAVITVLALPFVANTPARLNSKTISVDIRSGRIRTETYFCWVRLSSSVVESEVTRSLAATGEALPAAEWHTDSRFPIGGSVSPHYAFHGTAFGILRIEEALLAANASEAERQLVCRQFLRLLQESQSAYAAREYADAVWRAALETHALPR